MFKKKIEPDKKRDENHRKYMQEAANPEGKQAVSLSEFQFEFKSEQEFVAICAAVMGALKAIREGERPRVLLTKEGILKEEIGDEPLSKHIFVTELEKGYKIEFNDKLLMKCQGVSSQEERLLIDQLNRGHYQILAEMFNKLLSEKLQNKKNEPLLSTVLDGIRKYNGDSDTPAHIFEALYYLLKANGSFEKALNLVEKQHYPEKNQLNLLQGFNALYSICLNERKSEYKHSFLGMMGLGVKKTDKLAGSNALAAYIDNGKVPDEHHMKALKNGDLGVIAKHVFKVKPLPDKKPKPPQP